jgi:hypothetical protein
MRITVERFGGFAGLRLRRTIDTHDLPVAEARALQRLVSEAAFFEQPARITTRKRHPDRFQYTVHIEDGAKAHTVVMHEEAVSPTMRKLIVRLTAAAGEGTL